MAVQIPNICLSRTRLERETQELTNENNQNTININTYVYIIETNSNVVLGSPVNKI